MRLHAAPCISILYLKGLHAAPVVFEVYTGFHAAPCISRLNLNGLHKAPVLFEVYKVAPCDSMQLHAALCAPCIFRLYLNSLHTVPAVFEVYTGFHAARCGFMHL